MREPWGLVSELSLGGLQTFSVKEELESGKESVLGA